MQSMAVAFAVPEGKTEEVRQFVDELVGGSKSEQHHHRRREHGFDRIKVFRQHTPSEMIIVYVEADDVSGAGQQKASDNHEFEQWFESKLKAIHGAHYHHHSKGSPSELLIDWHSERGAAKSEHPV